MGITLVLMLIFIDSVSTFSISALTDSRNSTTEKEGKNADIIRSLLNQETIIRMALQQNVHILRKDLVTIQEKLTDVETKMSRNQVECTSAMSKLESRLLILIGKIKCNLGWLW